jgi:hypothetical protein
MTARAFTISLKPAWTKEECETLLSKLKGTATAWAIKHDKDTNENGEVVDHHTHFLLEYETPRKISTIANLFNVEANFVEVVKSKPAMLRYLTHKDDKDKWQYDDSEVMTNSDVPYVDVLMGQSLNDKQIADYIAQGRGYELLGLVSSSKLRTIQAFLAFERDGRLVNEVRHLNEQMNDLVYAMKEVHQMALNFKESLSGTSEALKDGFVLIAETISKAVEKQQTTRIKATPKHF